MAFPYGLRDLQFWRSPSEAKPITLDRIRECIDIMHWSSRDLGAILKCGEAQVRRWLIGTNPMPYDQAHWLNKMAEWMTDNPPPPVHKEKTR